jgi:hypothetical protein
MSEKKNYLGQLEIFRADVQFQFKETFGKDMEPFQVPFNPRIEKYEPASLLIDKELGVVHVFPDSEPDWMFTWFPSSKRISIMSNPFSQVRGGLTEDRESQLGIVDITMDLHQNPKLAALYSNWIHNWLNL